ncbi:MAG: transglycosylase domain-containing protein [Anaerorhabdus sp.]
MTQKKKTKKRSINKRNLAAVIISAILAVMLLVSASGIFILISMLSDSPEFNLDYYDTKESSQIFDQNGNLVADVGLQIRTNITYEDLPTSLIDAFVSIEDSRFFEHNGFDIPRFAKAMLENVKSLSFSQGGSTFTMQITKMTYFMDDESGVGAVKSISRKVQEIALAIELEKNTNKRTVFELYVNKSNFGGSGNIRGIQKAAEYYFGKDVTELNLAESAMLAGVVNAPYLFDPFNYLDYATNRRNTVLNMMLRHGYISQEECDLAKSIKVEDLLVDPYGSSSTASDGINYAYQSYIDTVIREVQTLTGLDPTSVPMKIYTYMDADIQAVMDSIQAGTYEGITFPDELMEIGMVTLNNETGEIVAIGGGRNYGRGGSLLLNHATDQYKQPGSSVKPIVDYALAFEYLGWSTSHVVTDRPIVYRGTDVVIKNFNGEYYGQVTLAYAVGSSLNTPAIQALQEVVDTVGRDQVVSYLQSLGFSKVTSENFDIGYAIGGSSFEVSVVELAAANATLANGGYYIQPHTVSRIEFSDGSSPLEPTYDRVAVLSEEAAYLTSQLMYEAVNGPYFNYMQLLKRNYAVYGKTGTTDWGTSGLSFNIPRGAAKDKWMISLTSEYTNVVWVGYEKGVKDAGTYFNTAKSQLNIPGKISNALITIAHADTSPTAIARPSGVATISHILGTWPYAYPIDGMDEKYLTTGDLKSEFANSLVAPETANIEQLNSFSIQYNDNGKFTLTWAPYPNADQLTVAADTMDLSLEVAGSKVEAWGTRIFDYTWIFGPVRYKAKVYANDELVKDIVTDSSTLTETFDLSPGTQTIKVCGFYSYEYLGESSNERCESISINIPTATPDLTTETGCKSEGYYWYNNECHEEAATPTPSPTPSPTPTESPAP